MKLADRLRRLEDADGNGRDFRAVRGFTVAEAAEREAELRASGYAGRVLRIVRTIVDPPPR